MQTSTRRSLAAVTWALGARKSIRPIRSRPEREDLRVFRQMSKISRRITGEEIDELIRPA
jgi:hypothetical protein